MDYTKPSQIVVFVLLALGVSAILLMAFGVPPLPAIGQIFNVGFSPNKELVSTLNTAAPLVVMAAGLIIPYRAGFWNIGGQGQYILGEIFATWVGLRLAGVPSAVALPMIFVSGFVGGALWAIPPTLMRIKFGVNEVISTLMMNFVAVYFLTFLLSGPMQSPIAKALNNTPVSDPIPSAFHLPSFGGSSLSSGLLIAVAFAIMVYGLLKFTHVGYELEVIGAQNEVAKYAGIRINRDVILSMVLSGGLAGLAGLIQVYSTTYVLLPQVFSDITTSYGYVGIPVAIIANLNSIAAIISSIFFAGILNGSYGLEATYHVSTDVVTTIYGLVMFFAVIGVYSRFGFVKKTVERLGRLKMFRKEEGN